MEKRVSSTSPRRNMLWTQLKAILHSETKCEAALRSSKGFWGTGEQGLFFPKEQGNKGLKIRGSGEHRQFWGIGNIENQDFVLGKHRNKAIFSSGTREQVPPCEGLSIRRMKYLELAFTKK